MAVSTFLPMATRTNTTITSPEVNVPANVNGCYLEVVPAAGFMDTPDEVVELQIEMEVAGAWQHVAGATFVGGAPLGKAGTLYLEVGLGGIDPTKARGKVIVTGTVRFRVDGEIRRVGRPA